MEVEVRRKEKTVILLEEATPRRVMLFILSLFFMIGYKDIYWFIDFIFGDIISYQEKIFIYSKVMPLMLLVAFIAMAYTVIIVTYNLYNRIDNYRIVEKFVKKALEYSKENGLDVHTKHMNGDKVICLDNWLTQLENHNTVESHKIYDRLRYHREIVYTLSVNSSFSHMKEEELDKSAVVR